METNFRIRELLYLIILSVCVLFQGVNSQGISARTELDNFRGAFVFLRRTMFGMTMANMRELYENNVRNGKRIPDSTPFFCDTNNTRSPIPPTSVDKVRPGDIDIISSIGDSLSAGNGALSETIGHILNEHRGISFSGGGRSTWRTFLTLPNILKEFNPNLYGYSTADGLTVDKSSKLNIAEPMIMSRDMTFQAKVLAQRMRKDPRVNMTSHWKLLTIYVGNNDVCSDMCHHQSFKQWAELHENELIKALRYLRDNIPRLIVNYVSVPNLIQLTKMNNLPTECYFIHRIGCHCLFSYDMTPQKLKIRAAAIADWQRREAEVCNRSEFNTEDFTVVHQPFMINMSIPVTKSGKTDLRNFASDCFHFSQRGHAFVAESLWNNMMQPVGRKQSQFSNLFERFECPSEKRPFIATRLNSVKDQT